METFEGVVRYQVMGSTFELPSQFEIVNVVGSGAYGVVVAVRNKAGDPSECQYAIKKIEKAFEHKVFAQRTLRELKIMRLLNHENVLQICNILLPEKRRDFLEIYVISELMETDLAQIIKSPQALTDDHIQFFLY